MKTDSSFLVKTYSKSELAHLYCPDISLCSALRLFKTWIEQNKELHNKLIETGYKPRNRYFFPKQVELIKEYLGEP